MRGEEGKRGEGRKAGDIRRTWDLTLQDSGHRVRSGNFGKIRTTACAPGTLQISSLRGSSGNFAKFDPPRGDFANREPSRALQELNNFRAIACALGNLQTFEPLREFWELLQNSSHRVRSGSFARREPPRALQELCTCRTTACAPGPLQS